MELTPAQRRILVYIQAYYEANGLPPTRQELAAELGFRSPNAIQGHLQRLEKKGALELLPKLSRGIRLRTPLVDTEPHRLPLVGRVAAGAPMLAEEHIEGYYPCPNLFRPPPDYWLRVCGESMRDIGIHDGDILGVHKTAQARDGQVVVCRIDGEVTVKRLHQRGRALRLLPENADFQPIDIDPHQAFAIEGVAVCVLGEVR